MKKTNNTYEAFVHILSFRNNIVRSLGQHHWVEERHDIIFCTKNITKVVLQIILKILDTIESLNVEEGVKSIDIHQTAAAVARSLAATVFCGILEY